MSHLQYNIELERNLKVQFYHLFQKDFKFKIRERTKAIFGTILPVFILFILIILNSSQTKNSTSLSYSLKPINSACVRPDCISIAYTTIGNVEPIVLELKSLVHAAEPLAAIQYFSSQQSLIDYQSQFPSKIVLGIVFQQLNSSSPVQYTILVNNSIFISGFNHTGVDAAIAYVQTAYINVNRQNLGITKFMSPLSENGISIQSIIGTSSNSIQFLIPYYMVFMFGPIIQNILSRLATEKTLKIKLGLLMMGTNPYLYLLSAITVELIFGLFTVLICCLMIYLGKLFVYTNVGITLLVFVLYIINAAIIGAINIVAFRYSLKIQNNHKVYKPHYALIVIGIGMIYIIFSLALFGLSKIYIWKLNNNLYNVLIMLFPTVAFSRALDHIVMAETVSLSIDLVRNSDFAVTVIMLFVDSIILLFLALYLDQVFGNFGIAQNWDFILKPQFWSRSFKKNEIILDSKFISNGIIDNPLIEQSNHETNKDQLIIKNLVKTFNEPLDESPVSTEMARFLRNISFTKKTKSFNAVNDLSLNLYSNQIFSLLGRNGAGKTTLISIITGVLRATSGSIFVGNNTGASYIDITNAESMNSFRLKIGICPQFDALYDFLTVRETLKMYAAIKGVNFGNELMKYLEALASDVELSNKLDSRVSTLSGGMKRKLSVAIALIGKPIILLLDEPSTGMDTMAQQNLWNLIEKSKKDKIVILTTHSMEEAEILGDVIAIVSKGKLQISGSSLFLKSHYGAGYQIIIETENNASHDKIITMIQNFFPTSTLKEHTISRIIISLGINEESGFSEFFSFLRTQNEFLTEILNLQLEYTSLEDVFVKMGE